MYRWYEHKLANKQNYHGSPEKPYSVINSAQHPRHPDTNLKLEAIKRCFSLGEGVEYVSREIGYSRMSIYTWYRQYKKYRVAGLMSSKKQIKRENIDFNTESAPAQGISELQDQINQLQMEVDVLKEALNLLKKGPGINVTELKNREKAVIIDAMKNKYPLPQLLKFLCMAKSSYYYQRAAIKRPDKYREIHTNIIELFKENRNCYGYRRIHSELKKIGIEVSEKIVRRIMKAEKLTVPIKRMRKYSSYKSESTPEVDNIIDRNFHADEPNRKWLTDITEFAIPAGKIYLSPIIDCFDGMVVSWNVSTTPDSILVNSMLEDAIGTLSPSEHPLYIQTEEAIIGGRAG